MVIIPHRPKCEFCGEYIDLRPEYCPYCGRPVPQTFDRKAMKEGTKISLVIGAIYILIIVIIMLYLYTH
jgi:predicted amidophosphoribosyltransferase